MKVTLQDILMTRTRKRLVMYVIFRCEVSDLFYVLLTVRPCIIL
jgi:hypothetical protein